MFFRQDAFDTRLEWGEAGVRELAPHCDVIVIVDVLSFSTCVDVALAAEIDASTAAPTLFEGAFVDRAV